MGQGLGHNLGQSGISTQCEAERVAVCPKKAKGLVLVLFRQGCSDGRGLGRDRQVLELEDGLDFCCFVVLVGGGGHGPAVATVVLSSATTVIGTTAAVLAAGKSMIGRDHITGVAVGAGFKRGGEVWSLGAIEGY